MASGTIKAVLSRGDVANNLTTSTAGKVLDASQGKILSDQIGNIDNKLEKNVFTNNTDANSYTTFGFYHVGISSNSPEGITQFGMLCVFTGGSGFVAQLFIETNNKMYFRYRNNSSSNWLAWQLVGLFSQIANVANGESFTMTSNQTYLTITDQTCKAYGKLKYFTVKFTTTSAAANYATLMNYGFGVGAAFYGQIYKPSTEKFITDCLAYSDYGNTGLRIIGGSLPAGSYIVNGVIISQ